MVVRRLDPEPGTRSFSARSCSNVGTTVPTAPTVTINNERVPGSGCGAAALRVYSRASP